MMQWLKLNDVGPSALHVKCIHSAEGFSSPPFLQQDVSDIPYGAPCREECKPLSYNSGLFDFIADFWMCCEEDVLGENCGDECFTYPRQYAISGSVDIVVEKSAIFAMPCSEGVWNPITGTTGNGYHVQKRFERWYMTAFAGDAECGPDLSTYDGISKIVIKKQLCEEIRKDSGDEHGSCFKDYAAKPSCVDDWPTFTPPEMSVQIDAGGIYFSDELATGWQWSYVDHYWYELDPYTGQLVDFGQDTDPPPEIGEWTQFNFDFNLRPCCVQGCYSPVDNCCGNPLP